MAVLGVQLVLTLVMLSCFNKFYPRLSMATRLLTSGLVRYLPPSDEALKELVGLPKTSRSSRKKKDVDVDNTKFNIPRNVTISLEPTLLKPLDLNQLPFFTEFQWLIDFSFIAIVIYTFSEVYYFLMPQSTELNLSMIWCALVLAYSLKVLYSITSLYFRGGNESIGERNLCIVSGGLFFLMAMIVLAVDESLLEFGLTSAYSSFNLTAYQMLVTHNVAESAYGPTSFLIVKFWLAVWCGFVGVFFTFPGLRFAQMHKDALIYAKDNNVLRLLLNVSFIAPIFIALLWVKPIARDYFTVKTWSSRGTIMTESNFETFRIVLIILVIALRFTLIKRYLQSYLNVASQKLQIIKKEAGRITNIDLQKTIARVYVYLCVVSLQFVTPLLICLFMTFVMKTLGDYSWTSYFKKLDPIDLNVLNSAKNESENATASLRNVFNPVVFRGLTGFMVWWLCSVWFSTSAIGFLYHTYFV